jgi:hypothetical protein
MAVDLLCTKTQMFYTPLTYGQYPDPSGKIWTIIDEDYLATAYSSSGTYLESQDATAALVSFEARWNVTTGEPLSESAATDVQINAFYTEDPGSKYVAFLVGLSIIAIFAWMVIQADWKRTYALEAIEKQTRVLVFDSAQDLSVWKTKASDLVAEMVGQGLRLRKSLACDGSGQIFALEWSYEEAGDGRLVFGSFGDLPDETGLVLPVKMTLLFEESPETDQANAAVEAEAPVSADEAAAEKPLEADKTAAEGSGLSRAGDDAPAPPSGSDEGPCQDPPQSSPEVEQPGGAALGFRGRARQGIRGIQSVALGIRGKLQSRRGAVPRQS